MSWLSGFSNRLKLKIDNTKVDDTLLNFPVLIKISNSSGISSLDVTPVFTELGSDANRKKIAVTTLDGTTQCYVEIERFDYSNNEAWLWVKVPSVASGAETILYLYYDLSQDDNTSYVGDTGDTPAQNVWDSNFKLIMHMSQDPNGDVADAIKDSTSNVNHGTPGGSMTSADLVNGKVGKAIDFDGGDDCLSLPTNDGLYGQDEITVEAVVSCAGIGTTWPDYRGTIYSTNDVGNTKGFSFWFDDDAGAKKITIQNRDSEGGTVDTATSVWIDSTDYHVVMTHKANISQEIWLNKVLLKSDIQNWDFQKGTVSPTIGKEHSDEYEWPGFIDEVRISNIARSAAWIKATYYSNWDELITFEIPLNPDDWSNRLKLTIPADSTDSSLTNFPVMMNLSSSSGKTGFDATAVFDELGDDHQKRFAITKNDSTTQCPVEIEYWDATEEKAVLWTKIPTVYSSVDTVLYLYYDSSQSDNTTYVGDTGDTPAQNVWDSNFKLIMHMAQDPNGDVADAIKDSTSNAIHATPVGSMATADLVDGKVGKAIEFDESDDYLKTASADDALNITDTLTLEAIIKPSYTLDSGLSVNIGIFSRQETPNTLDSYGLLINPDGKLHLGTSGGNIRGTKVSWVLNTNFYIAGTYNSSGLNGDLFVDNTKEVLTTDSYDTMAGGTNSVLIGSFTDTSQFFPGIIDEVRISNTVRSDAWIKATYYSNWDNFIVFQQEEIITNWLSDWSKRIKLTIDKDKIDSTLVDFPINITLDSDTGLTNTDVTDVFTTISGGSKKIAITTSDGITQCYVEIERWDTGNEQANLWTKVPTVSSNEDTILYLYYDNSKSDNISYIGDTTGTPAQNVWDSNFKLVMHMAQDPNGDVVSAIKDSTNNANHGTPSGSMTTADLVDGKIGKAIGFDGSNDRIDLDTSLENDPSILMVEIVGKNLGTGGMWFSHRSEITRLLQIYTPSNAEVNFQMRGSGNNIQIVTKTGLTLTNFTYTAAIFDKVSDNHKLYIDDLSVETSNYDFGTETFTSTKDIVGAYYDDQYRDPLLGVLDEVRISNIARSAAWIKATYYSNWDGLVSFGSEQEMPTHYYYGYVTEEELPVSRTVMLYYRNTGELVGHTTSNSDTGYYYLTTTISGEHFIVTIDNDAGKNYNALVLDRLLPRGIE